jgi:hypothetical protein
MSYEFNFEEYDIRNLAILETRTPLVCYTKSRCVVKTRANIFKGQQTQGPTDLHVRRTSIPWANGLRSLRSLGERELWLTDSKTNGNYGD